MSLFQHSVVKKYILELNAAAVKSAYEKFNKHFGNTEIQNNIRELKEEQYQEGFLRELFGDILGYTLSPQHNFNLLTEKKNEKDAKKADGAILQQGVDSICVIAVIELKGTDTTDLSKVENQAFGYKNNQKDCKYVIVSNFEKLRFYIDNAIEFEEFDLFKLSEERFQLLYLCLAKENLLNGIPAKIKEASISQEENITKKLYSDYSSFKKALYLNIITLTPQFDKLTLFKKTQKLLDRFLFIFFAEDRLLLPPNSIQEILKQWNQLKELDNYIPLYERFKKYFGYMNTGYKGKQYDIYAYNGGLFASDEVLDNIAIDDAVLNEHTLKLSNYDFDTEVDVNILGHIFEHSLNEIEEVQSELEGKELDKSKTKRKKDGVYYTPKYITKYIVENTVGALCTEKKKELEINDDEIVISKSKTKNKELIEKIDIYRDWLLGLTICDPACGSGAFLNQALDFLLSEHKKLDELKARITKSPIIFSDIENSVLENNIFGVDLNEEAVQIARLSLWLKTAQKGRKLSDLSKNIKCGNSLIDDPAIAGEKAFNWQNEFPEIFANGGFDIVIGNPPYVFARDNFHQLEKDYYSENYSSVKYQINTYLLFIEKSVRLLKSNGNLGLIIPNSWLMVYSGEELRRFLLETSRLRLIINLEGYSFESANVETVILIADKTSKNDNNILHVLLNNGIEFYYSHSKNQNDFTQNEGYEFRVFLDDESDGINSKILKDSDILDNIVQIKAGLQAYEKDKGDPMQTAEDVINRPYDYTFKFDDATFQYLDGKDVGRYQIHWSGLYLRYGKHLAAPRTFDLFNGKKIIVREITGNYPKCLISTYTESIYLYNRSNIAIIERDGSNISLKYVIAILNSSLISYYFLKNTAKSVRKMFPKIILNDLRKFPIKKVPLNEQQLFIDKADLMLSLNNELQDLLQKFHRSFQRKFGLEELSNKLKDWYMNSYEELIKELSKKKIKLSLAVEAEWEDYFIEESKKALEIKAKIETTDKEIDQMVYELYGLTEEEIRIIENT